MKQSNQNTENQASVFSALADPTRLRLLKLLCSHEPGALCVNAMAGLLGVTQPAVSQHLKVLKGVGLVNGKRQGYHIHYSVNSEALEHCRDLVTAVLSTPGTGQFCCKEECNKEAMDSSDNKKGIHEQ